MCLSSVFGQESPTDTLLQKNPNIPIGRFLHTRLDFCKSSSCRIPCEFGYGAAAETLEWEGRKTRGSCVRTFGIRPCSIKHVACI